MPRRKAAHSRRRSLIFTESPINASKILCSPVLGANHPVTAETVLVDDNLDLGWVSPQFNPNNTNTTPKRRRKGARSRAACHSTRVPSSSQLLRKDTVGSVPNHSKEDCQQLPRGFTRLKFVGEQETECKKSNNPADVCPETEIGRQLNNVNGRHLRSKGRPKCYGGKPRNCSINQSLNPDDFEIKLNALDSIHGNLEIPQEVQDSQHKMHQQQRLGPDDTLNNLCRSRRSSRIRKEHSSNELPYSSKLKHKSRTSPDFPGKEQELAASTSRDETCTNTPKCNNNRSCVTRGLAHRLLYGSVDTRSVQGRVLVSDTPEAEYGLKVSIRRRRDLLPLTARNKLLCL